MSATRRRRDGADEAHPAHCGFAPRAAQNSGAKQSAHEEVPGPEPSACDHQSLVPQGAAASPPCSARQGETAQAAPKTASTAASLLKSENWMRDPPHTSRGPSVACLLTNHGGPTPMPRKTKPDARMIRPIEEADRPRHGPCANRRALRRRQPSCRQRRGLTFYDAGGMLMANESDIQHLAKTCSRLGRPCDGDRAQATRPGHPAHVRSAKRRRAARRFSSWPARGTGGDDHQKMEQEPADAAVLSC